MPSLQTSTLALIALGAILLLAATALLLRWALADRLISRVFREAAEGDFETAAQRLQVAAEQNDPRGVRHEALGFLYFQRSRWAEAAQAFAMASSRDPARVVRRIYQAHSLARAGKADDAQALLQQLQAQRPEDVAPLCGLALLLTDSGQTAAAAECYWKARQLLEKHPGIQTAESIGLMDACAEAIGRAVTPAPSQP